MELDVTARLDPHGRHRLSVAGALDLASRQRLLDAGTQLLGSEGTKTLAVDLSAVRFCDSSGLGALIELAGEADDQDVAFSLVNPTDRVLRLLDVAGMRDVWPIVTE